MLRCSYPVDRADRGRKQIRDVTHAYKVYFAKTAPAIRSDPNINHSSVVYVVGVDGNYIGFFPPGTPADRMVAVLQSQLAVLAKASPDRKDARLQWSARVHETIMNVAQGCNFGFWVINCCPGNVRVSSWLHI